MACYLSFQADCCVDYEDPDFMVLKDKHALCEDLKYILSEPDLCDVMFLVGPEQYQIHGLRAILASRSKVFYQLLLSKERELRQSLVLKKMSFWKKLKQIPKILKSRPYSEQTEPQRKLIITLEEYDPNVFERLIRYVHCGIVSVDVFSVIGLLNAAEKFEIDCLQNACWDFAIRCIRPDVVHDLIASANEYSQNKTTSLLIQKIHEISLNNPETLYYSPSRSGSIRDLNDHRPKSITTNGLLMRSVL